MVLILYTFFTFFENNFTSDILAYQDRLRSSAYFVTALSHSSIGTNLIFTNTVEILRMSVFHVIIQIGFPAS